MYKYKTLIQVLKELPNVAPITAKKYIISTFIEGKPKIVNRIFTEEEINEIYITHISYYGETIRTSPIGAKLLIKLYEDALLPMKANGSILNPSQEIVEYSNHPDSYEKDCKYKARSDYLIQNPDQIKENDFSYTILNDTIYKQCGPGSQFLTIANIKITKTVTNYKSNSGKSSDYEVLISWIDTNGKPHSLKKESIYRGNRCSDPDRNWGLGRE